MIEDAADFAGLLRQLRDKAGLTQEELADAARLGVNTVSDLERGRHQTCQKQTAQRLAGALGLTGQACDSFIAAARGLGPAAAVLATGTGEAALAAGSTASLPGLVAVPVLARPVAVPRELPAEVGAFTGRAVELAELDFHLPAATSDEAGGALGPVVISVVSGTAGVGKTALAIRWAHRMATRFPDGQLYVNLRGYDPDQPVSPGEALAGFLRALGVASADIPLAEAERAARYRSVLAGRRLLVVLDNAATVEQVRPLLPGTPSAMVVITSRDSLPGLVARDGARRLDLDLLPADDAAALLRALIGGRAEADPTATETLAAQCARLPLALRVAAELAAARPDTLLAQLSAELAGLQDRLELLDAGGDPRGAVVSVFSWSYRHLSAEAARMFRLLGLHPGADWDRYAAAALTCASAARAGQLLARLAQAHLIQPAGAGRYGMHDLLRAYAAGLATSHDDDQDRHAALTSLFDYYLVASAAAMDCLAPAERHHRPDPPPARMPAPGFSDRAAARAWLDAELASLTAVAAHTAGHGWPGHTTRLAATLYRYLAGGHHTEALTIYAHALTAARDSGDRAAEARTLTDLGAVHGNQGRRQQAEDCHRQALTIAEKVGDRFAQAWALTRLGSVHGGQGQYRQAADCHRQSFALFREMGDRFGQVVELDNLGSTYIWLGRYQQAADLQQQSLALARQIDDQIGVAYALTGLGRICYRQGRYQAAADHLQQALAVSRETGYRTAETDALTCLGEVCHRQGRYAAAAGYQQQALALWRETGNPGGEAWALNGAGETLLATGQPDQAQTCHTTALTLSLQTGTRPEQGRALAGLGQVCRRQGRYDEAAGYCAQALTLYRDLGDPAGEADVLNGTGETLLATGQPEQAHASHTAALILADQIGDRYQQARAHRGLAAACHATGQHHQAHQHRQHAQDIYTDLGVPDIDWIPDWTTATE